VRGIAATAKRLTDSALTSDWILLVTALCQSGRNPKVRNIPNFPPTQKKNTNGQQAMNENIIKNKDSHQNHY
jgi:hypothetical protein